MNTLPAPEQITFLLHLGSVLAKPISQLGGASSGEEVVDILSLQLSGDVVGKILGELLVSLNNPETLKQIKVLFTGLKKNGANVMFDLEFSGELPFLCKELIPWAFMGNFGSFFGASGGLDDILAKLRSLSPKTPRLTGASAGSS